MIISASRRTDIPAFYAEWFMNRLEAGFVLTRNPFNARQIRRVELRPERVEAIVFWTRNPTRLLPYLDRIDALGHRYYFQFTLTGYPRALERATPALPRAIRAFRTLAERLGPERVIWRYDPILLSNLTPLAEHLRLFGFLAKALEGHTRRVVISFADLYPRVAANLRKVSGLVCEDITQQPEQLHALAARLAALARDHGMRVQTCAEALDLGAHGIVQGKCIDEALLGELFELQLSPAKDPGQRRECRCIRSLDIGAYDSCPQGCVYCYASTRQQATLAHYRRHDPRSPFLVGDATGAPPELLLPG